MMPPRPPKGRSALYRERIVRVKEHQLEAHVVVSNRGICRAEERPRSPGPAVVCADQLGSQRTHSKGAAVRRLERLDDRPLRADPTGLLLSGGGGVVILIDEIPPSAYAVVEQCLIAI